MFEMPLRKRLAITILLIIAHLIVFFPGQDVSLTYEGMIWVAIQGPLALTEMYPYPIGIVAMFWYLGEVISLILWQIYPYHPPTKLIFGIFLFFRIKFELLLFWFMFFGNYD